MYDFSKYKDSSLHGILRLPENFSDVRVEKNAKIDYEDINKDELRNFFLKVISELLMNDSVLIDKKFDIRIEQYKKKFKDKRLFMRKKEDYQIMITEKYNSEYSFYKRGFNYIKESKIKDIKKRIDIYHELSLGQLDKTKYFIDKLVFINDFKENLEKSVINVGLFEKINEEPKIFLINIFKNEVKYSELISEFKEYKIIQINKNSTLQIIKKDSVTKHMPTLLSAFAYILNDKGLFNTNSREKFAEAIRNTFNESLSAKHLRNTFDKLDFMNDFNESEYVSFFKVILSKE